MSLSSPAKPPPVEASSPSSAGSGITIIKDGILFKKRDHFNEYPPRYFVLNSNSTLFYHRNYNEPPVRSIAIDKNILITFDEKPIQYNHQSLFLFYISSKTTSSSSTPSYILGAKTENERKLWLTELETMVNKSKNLTKKIHQDSRNQSSPQRTPKDQDIIQLATQPSSTDTTSSFISTIVAPENPAETYANLSDKLKQKIDSVAYAILTLSNELPLPSAVAATTDPQSKPSSSSSSSNLKSDWNLIYEKNNILGYRKSGTGVVCVRGETVLPYTIPEICSLTKQWTNEIEPNLDTYERLTWLSKHTGVEHVKYKPVWPTAPRDFVNMTHWRVLKHDPNRILHPNSTEKESTYLLNFSFSEQSVEEKYCPPLDGYVRGNVLVGYVMKHVPGGTRVIFIIQCDLGGSVPISVTNFIARSKPLVLVAIRKALDKRYKYRERPNILALPQISYQDVSQVVEHNYHIFLQQNPSEQQSQQQRSESESEEKQDQTFAFEESKEMPTGDENLLPLTATSLENLSSSSSSSTALGSGSPVVTASASKNETLEMVVYKKRDHLNTWVLRYLTCDGEYLHYYQDTDEVFPKRSLLIDEHLKIQMDILPVVIENQKRFTFTVTHPQMKIQYILACNTMEESLQWSNLIQNIQRQAQKSSGSHLEGQGQKLEEGYSSREKPEEGNLSLPPPLQQPFVTRQISDEIQYYELDYSPSSAAAAAPGGGNGSFGQMSLTRLVITSLPLYYLTILWSGGESSLQSVIKLILFIFILAWAYLEWNLNRLVGPSLLKNPNLFYPGRHLYRLKINIQQFKKHLSPHSLHGCMDTITTTQVMLKILANLISATPALNGYLLFQKFYPSLQTDSVDLSVYHETTSSSSTQQQQPPPHFYKLPSLTAHSKLSTIQTLQHSYHHQSHGCHRIPLLSLLYDYLSLLFQVYLNLSLSSLYDSLHGVLPYGVAMIYLPTETIDTHALYFPQHLFTSSSCSCSSVYSVPLVISMNEISLQQPFATDTQSSSSTTSSATSSAHLPSLPTSPLGLSSPTAPMSPKSSLHAVDLTRGGSGSNGKSGVKSVHWENAQDEIMLNIWIDNLAMSATESAEFIQKLQEYFHY